MLCVQCPVSPAPVPPNSDPANSGAVSATLDPLTNQEKPGSGQTNQEKRRNVQEQLALLLHAHRCQRKDQMLHAAAAGAPGGPGGGTNGVVGVATPHCTDPKCSSMKLILKHMTECNEGKSCKGQFGPPRGFVPVC